MPIHTFECKKCNLLFEELLPSQHSKNPNCPNCNKKTNKIISKPRIIKQTGITHTVNKVTTPIENNKGGILASYAHVADRNTGKSLGFIQTGVIDER